MDFHEFSASMIEYSTGARAVVRVRQKFFSHHIFPLILNLLGIFGILISFKLIDVDAFEY